MDLAMLDVKFETIPNWTIVLYPTQLAILSFGL